MDQVVKGPDLERRIAAYFDQNDYSTELNVVREGRSGARHEVDVLATKSDGVMEFSVLVECKAWEAPISKEVVSKLSLVMNDLGVNKGIVVSLRGWRTGAELTARQLGIDLWGTEEIRDKLGSVAVAEISASRSVRVGRGFQTAVAYEVARDRLMRSAAGFLGLASEAVIWVKLIWIPCFLVAIDRSYGRQAFLRGTVVETARQWNLYDGLSVTYLTTIAGEPGLTDVDLGLSIAPLGQARKLQRDIAESLKRRHSVVTEAAIQRHVARLAELGIPADALETVVTSTETVYLPFYTSLLRTGSSLRVSVVDAVWGGRWHKIDRALSAQVSYLVNAVGADPGPEAAELSKFKRLARPRLRELAIVFAIGVAEYFVVGPDPIRVVAVVSATIGILLRIQYQRWKGLL